MSEKVSRCGEAFHFGDDAVEFGGVGAGVGIEENLCEGAVVPEGARDAAREAREDRVAGLPLVVQDSAGIVQFVGEGDAAKRSPSFGVFIGIATVRAVPFPHGLPLFPRDAARASYHGTE